MRFFANYQRPTITLGIVLSSHPFDLTTYLSENFPSLTLGGGLFYRWPVGIRFALGIEAFSERAPKLYEAVFTPEDACVIISQNWPEESSLHQQYFPVFSLPGVFDSEQMPVQRLEITTQENDEPKPSFLQWTERPARSFRYVNVLEGIANADHVRSPSVLGRVYFLNPSSAVIVHMYDDRGLDMIAARTEAILPVYEAFKDWALDFDRERIAQTFSK
jgi:hypothetical protein